jgi:hypothetical protein
VPQNQKWRFAMEDLFETSSRTASVRWNSTISPNNYAIPELPIGTHKIEWIVEDGCGNQSICAYPFNIEGTTLVATQNPETDGFELYQNEPNPFHNSTVIRFKLPEPSMATLSIFDTEGRLLYRQTAEYNAGVHALNLEKEPLRAIGVLFYKLEAGKHLAWRKMLRIKN